MIKETLETIAQWVNGTIEGDQATEIRGISFDTRKISRGNLFIPFVGERDGHAFVADAYQKGAVAALWQVDSQVSKPEGIAIILVEDTLAALQTLASAYLHQVNPKVIGITGSNGKTTTKDMLANVLATTYRVHKTQGNYNNHIGVPYTILNMPYTTEVLVLEMGMNHAGEIAVLTKIAQPDIAIITNIGEAHLEFLKSRGGIADAKLEIAEGLAADGVLIYPDDPLLTERLMGNTPFERQHFGASENNAIYPTSITALMAATEFKTSLTEQTQFHVPIVGVHNVYNALAVILGARRLQVTDAAIKAGLAIVDRTADRLEWIDGTKGIKILSDVYNSSPTALKAVLETFGQIQSDRRKVVVVADMLELGAQAPMLHAGIADSLTPAIDEVFAYGPYMSYFSEAAKSLLEPAKVHYFTDLEKLTTALQDSLVGDELLLFKGSNSMKLNQVVAKLTDE